MTGRTEEIFICHNCWSFFRQDRDRLRIEKQDPLNHMSKYVDELKRKRDDEPKPTKKTSSSSVSSSSSSMSRIEQLRAERYDLKIYFDNKKQSNSN